MRRLICSVAMLISVAGCSGTVPASGETVDGEKFSGTFSRRTDGIDGVVALTSDQGATCNGRWHLDEDRRGSITVTCSDGRTGTAELNSDYPNGTIRGMLGGKRFEGAFEDPMQPLVR